MSNTINDFDILALSETWLNEKTIIKFNNFNILRADGPFAKSGGLILAIKKHIPYLIEENIYYLENVLVIRFLPHLALYY